MKNVTPMRKKEKKKDSTYELSQYSYEVHFVIGEEYGVFHCEGIGDCLIPGKLHIQEVVNYQPTSRKRAYINKLFGNDKPLNNLFMDTDYIILINQLKNA